MDHPNDYEDNTDTIRATKHSANMAEDVLRMEELKKTCAYLRAYNPMAFAEMVCEECAFLSRHYMEIFHKLIKDELDAATMLRFIEVLRQIEDGEMDQHAGSVLVGKMLKDMYLDSAVRAADALDAKYAKAVEAKPEVKDISWEEYKRNRQP
jgi:hypothetical protein